MAILDELKSQIVKRLPELDVVIGWGEGFDPLHATPLFMKTEADVDRLVFNPLSVHNLATYLTRYGKGKKLGVVVKGCDCGSVVELLQEKLIAREDVVIFGVPCTGVLDLGKIRRELADKGLDMGRVRAVAFTDAGVALTVSGQDVVLPLGAVQADKCGRCARHNAVIHDAFAGQPVADQAQDAYQDVAAFEAMTLEERMDFWRDQMQRCVRCYACRNACPLCVCRDHCIGQSREPNWVSQRDGLEEKLFFQMIHATHLAGRCTECGECERACPVDIPLLLFKRKLNKEILDLFDYRAGAHPEAKPPLLSFKVQEDNINERGW